MQDHYSIRFSIYFIILVYFCRLITFRMSENSLNDNLLAGQGKKNAKEYKNKIQNCELKIRSLKNKNNELQKQSQNDLQTDVRRAIKDQNQFIEAEITKLKSMLEEIGKTYKDPATKNKLKELWMLAARQFERYKVIMNQIVNKAPSESFVAARNSKRVSKSNLVFQQNEHQSDKNIMSSDLVHDNLENEFMMHQRVQQERNATLKELEEKNQNIYKIMNQIGQMVGGQQADLLNELDTNMNTGVRNVNEGVQHLQEASGYQRKSKKKYVIIVFIVLIIVAAVGGIVYIASK